MAATGIETIGFPEHQRGHQCDDQGRAQRVEGVAEGEDVGLLLHDMADRDIGAVRSMLYFSLEAKPMKLSLLCEGDWRGDLRGHALLQCKKTGGLRSSPCAQQCPRADSPRKLRFHKDGAGRSQTLTVMERLMPIGSDDLVYDVMNDWPAAIRVFLTSTAMSF